MDKFKTKIKAIAKKKLKTPSPTRKPQKPQKPRLVICAGMHRSGSTFTYNICHALGLRPMGYIGSVPIGLRRGYIYKTGTLKVHFLNYHESLQHEDVKIITSYRDARDIYISLMLKDGYFDKHAMPDRRINSGVINKIHQDIKSVKSLLNKNNVMTLNYERDIIPSETKVIDKIAKFLNIHEYDTNKIIDMVGIERIKKLQNLKRCDRPSFCYGIVSDTHISKLKGKPGTHMALDKKTLKMLHDEFGDYLEEFGYIKNIL